jgi:hypothetical protein
MMTLAAMSPLLREIRSRHHSIGRADVSARSAVKASG